MAKLITVNKTVRMDLFEIIKFQLMVHCFINKITLNETEFNCLALLGCQPGKIRLVEFCRMGAEYKILGNSTAVNNCLSRVERSKLFIKEGAGKKMIFLNPELGIQTKENILLNYKFIRVESDKNTGIGSQNSTATQLA